jgi:hypothetical protein
MHLMDGYTMAQARQEELLREAEHERLIRAARLQQPRQPRFHRRWANWLGVHMARWGQKLEDFGTFRETGSASSISSQH